MAVRGVRGATTVDSNSKEEILTKTEELVKVMIHKNQIEMEDIASAIFSVTEDLNEEFPAVAVRRLGWIYTPLLCTREIPVKNSLKGCIRVLLHVNTEKRQEEIVHVYLYGAKKLRPDLDSGVDDRYYTSEISSAR